jgi:methylmalonyl-CoA/ethylmalonyl-CoA epimerase
VTRSGYNQLQILTGDSHFVSFAVSTPQGKVTVTFMEKNMPKVKQINHVAVVVQDMQKALLFWRDALGMEMHELREVPAEKSQVAFLPLPGSEVELVRPTTEDSGIAKYLAKRGPGMHHLCLEVDDIEGMLSELKSKGIRLINEEPRTAADGKRYAFIHPESTSGVLVELYQI